MQIRSNSHKIQILKRFGIILVWITAACLSAWADAKSDATLALIRERLSNSVGKIPWDPSAGYALEGQFILKATGEDIPYKARYARALNRWVSDFSQEDPARNLRYAFSGERAWVASPEITVDLKPALLPYMARFDFYQLYSALLRILEKGTRDPIFSAETVANEIHISGKLQDGWSATFIFNMVDYFPRKVSVTLETKPAAAWLIPFTEPNGSGSILNLPGISSEFEIWLSDPVNAGSYRYPRRMDFVENEKVVGTFLLEKLVPIAEAEALFDRPPDFPWAAAVRFEPRKDLSPSSRRPGGIDLSEFRTRMHRNPWFRWNWRSHLVALWAIPTAWMGRLFPHSISFRLTLLAAVLLFLGTIFLLLHRRHQTGDSFRWSLLLAGFLVSCLVVAGWAAAYQLHHPRPRSLIALHSAIRYVIANQSFYSGRADSLLRDFESEAPAQSMEELGHSCEAYALAYALIRSDLPRGRQVQIENALFRYALPLWGATRGWASNSSAGSVIAAGLGMVGLTLDYEPYITAACEVLNKTLKTQLTGGLYQSGPGPGALAMDSAVNLFYGLKISGRGDYYANESFRRYLDTTLQMISPVGTLPLFGNTSLDQSDRLREFLLKVASHVPDREGQGCLAASNRYEAYGRYHASGWARWILPPYQTYKMVFENPYLLFQYTRDRDASALPSSSTLLGDGQSAVLRTGGGPDAAYLALNTARSSYATHRDLLTFDLYAYGSLLLHGPGFPGTDSSDYAESIKTAASNSITFNGEDQSSTQGSGIEASLLNQPAFDYVRALADTTYSYGQVRRDIVMVRPEGNRPAYFLLLDDVHADSPEASVQWHLHGRGNLVTGIAQSSRWTTDRFEPPRPWPQRVVLDVSFPVGVPGKMSRKLGKLYSHASYLNHNSESTTIEWMGSNRLCCVLAPRASKAAQAKMESIGDSSFRIGAADWVSLGRLDAMVSAGPIRHVSEYVLIRDQAASFPALLMVSGQLCQFGVHSIASSKPITVSLKGFYGGFINPRPDTEVEIRTPSVKPGDHFRLDGQSVVAAEPGVLRLRLENAGEHALRPEN
jgi:hypothetical protein